MHLGFCPILVDKILTTYTQKKDGFKVYSCCPYHVFTLLITAVLIDLLNCLFIVDDLANYLYVLAEIPEPDASKDEGT